ncbi:MAG: DUF4436 family protein [Candidatus Acidiferrales bacterium]
MRERPARLKIVFVISILVLYATVLLRGTTESTRRILQLSDETTARDRVAVSVLVTNVNPVAQELTAQLSFRLAGRIARDEVTPAEELKLLINNVGGHEDFDFPPGKRVNPIEAVFPLNGDWNKYPFDQYDTTMWLLMTVPAAVNKANVPKVPDDQTQESAETDQLAIGAATLEHNTPIPLSVSVSAAIRGIKFRGSVTRNQNSQVIGVNLRSRHADNLIGVSLLINAMMAALAISVLAMVLHVRAGNTDSDLIPLSMSMTLIFGLPALRSVQPGVPPVGAFSDYVIFIWAELIVAVSAVVTVWHWLLRARTTSELH